MKNDLTTFASLTIEALTEACKDAFEECVPALVIVEEHWKILETFGRLLTAAKSKVPHGEWANWITDTFAGRLAIRTAQRWMSDSNAPLLAHLKSDEVPRKDRISERVEVIEPGQTDESEPDSDPSPTPTTNRKASAGNRKKSESTKPKTQPIVPEIVDEPASEPDPVEVWISSHSVADVVGRMVEKLNDDKARKSAAKQLRKLADKLDPPTKFVAPDVEEVTAYFAEINCDLSPQYFIDFYGKGGWLISKGKPMTDWRRAARNANDSWERKTGNSAKSGTARVPAPPRKPVVYNE